MNKMQTRRLVAKGRNAFRNGRGLYRWNHKDCVELAMKTTHNMVKSDVRCLSQSGFVAFNSHIAYINW